MIELVNKGFNMKDLISIDLFNKNFVMLNKDERLEVIKELEVLENEKRLNDLNKINIYKRKMKGCCI